MGVPVEEVLKLPMLEKANVQTPVYDRDVEWISVIETPVENFVRNNEFVLSTGVGCGENIPALEAYVKDVIRSDASILAFATGRHLFKIPDRIIALAEQHELVLVEIPWEVRFADILQGVLQLINEEKQKVHRHVEGIRQELINCVLNGKGLQEITTILYQYTGLPNAISDHLKHIRANQHFDSSLIDALNGRKEAVVSLIEHPFRLEHPLTHFIEAYQIGEECCYQLTILSNYKKQGYLLFQPEKDQEVTTEMMTILEHTLTACALYFVKENAIEMTEIRLKDNFLLDLAKQEQRMDKQLLSKAGLLGYDLEKPYVCFVGEVLFHQPASRSVGNDGQLPSSSSLQSRNYYIQKEAAYAGHMVGRQVMTTFDEERVIIFLEADKEGSEEAANQFLDLVERRLFELLAGVTIQWGISCHKDGYQVFHHSYEEARTALQMGEQQNEAGGRTFFKETRMNRLLMALSHKKEIEEIVQDTLQPLIDYDQKRQAELLHTFMVYNKYNSNVSQTSRALNLHRQSLLHRLRNIEQLTGLSLLNADDLFLLELSVRLWLLKKVEKSGPQ
ncbi:PucR family transcriptional regulator ligand-binding domain-containing protein [Halobacillus kuroshimensis]|uniref:PucR family transcriptional regulator ligand-binding domain-containing protein n=1 Tax=Halobacillus kuroshimensis TaxID=302481 RepID=A0ABS3DY56_9BACI|nr:PucR family transcriptional regulator [Halobacillus kuroshimensis]MBN8236253.1 PucR family transcriptional regulator ligand-binding domain-containing protein [Halobacillus kuroshimensis]